MSEKGIIVFKVSGTISQERRHELTDYAHRVAKGTGYSAVVADDSVAADVHPPVSELVDAIRQQTTAIQQLVESNAALIQAMAEADGDALDDENREPECYLDGSAMDFKD